MGSQLILASNPEASLSSLTGRRLACLGLLMATIPCGLIVRMAPLGLPYVVTKYGGSMLWAVALYWLLGALLPNLRPQKLVVVALIVSAGLEFTRLWHTPATNAFRLTLAGKLLLGRIFSLKNIAAYWVAIGFTASIDYLFRRADAPKASR